MALDLKVVIFILAVSHSAENCSSASWRSLFEAKRTMPSVKVGPENLMKPFTTRNSVLKIYKQNQ